MVKISWFYCVHLMHTKTPSNSTHKTWTLWMQTETRHCILPLNVMHSMPWNICYQCTCFINCPSKIRIALNFVALIIVWCCFALAAGSAQMYWMKRNSHQCTWPPNWIKCKHWRWWETIEASLTFKRVANMDARHCIWLQSTIMRSVPVFWYVG